MDLTFFYVCHCSIKGRIFSLVAVERPQDLILSCVHDLWCDVGGTGALALGEDTEYSFFCSFSLLGVLYYVIFHLLCNPLDYTDVWHCSQPPALNVGVLAIGFDVSDVTFT